MMVKKYHIIGGGIVGASIAYHLSCRTDAPVVVHEQGELASETTRKSLAFFGYYGDHVQYRMKQYAMDLYNEFFTDPTADPAYTLVGKLNVATSVEGELELEEEFDTMTQVHGERSSSDKNRSSIDTSPIDFFDSENLSNSMVLPYLDIAVVKGAIYRPQVGYLRPQELAKEFINRAETNGVTFIEHSKVEEICTTNDHVTGIIANGESIDTTEVICAAGPWNPKIARSVGVEIPVKHTLAPVVKLEPATNRQYSLPWITHHESGFSIRRNTDGTILMTHHPVDDYDVATEYDPSNVDETVPEDIRDRGLETLERLLPATEDAEIVDEWVGIRSSTPDRNPIVGWTSLEGFSIAAFSTSGIQLSPATGNVISSQLIDDDPTSYYEALSVTRFEEYTDWR